MLRIIIFLLLIIPAFGSASAEKFVIVNKVLGKLFVKDGNDVVMEAPVCLGRGIGQKTRKGDHKTPEGVFKIVSVESSSGWTEDFKDGKGPRKGAYGPWFFRLNTPQSTHIGIHGTCFPESMGGRESDGCVRLRNEDLEQLKTHVGVGTQVLITRDPVDPDQP